jgi:hypothetical protein
MISRGGHWIYLYNANSKGDFQARAYIDLLFLLLLFLLFHACDAR